MASQCGNYFWHGSSARTAQQDVGLPSAPGYARQKPPGNIAYRIVYYDFFRNAMFPMRVGSRWERQRPQGATMLNPRQAPAGRAA